MFCYIIKNLIISSNFNDFIVKSPSTLKLETCKNSYIPIEKQIGGKNARIEYIYKNDEGISGGKFTKREMFKALLDNEHINCKLKTSLLPYRNELVRMKNIPKPIDDVVDAMWLVFTTIHNVQ